MKWGYQDNLKPLYFFLRKDLTRTKSIKRKTNNFYPLICARKIVAFVVKCFLNFVLLINVCLWMFLCERNIFIKEKDNNNNKPAWNFLDNLMLLYYWGVHLSIHLSSLLLYAFVFIYNYLWESLLIYNHLCESIFLKSSKCLCLKKFFINIFSFYFISKTVCASK